MAKYLSGSSYGFKPSDASDTYFSAGESKVFSLGSITFTIYTGVTFSFSSSTGYTYRPTMMVTWDKTVRGLTCDWTVGSTSSSFSIVAGSSVYSHQCSAVSSTTIKPQNSTGTTTITGSLKVTLTGGTTNISLSKNFYISFQGLWCSYTFKSDSPSFSLKKEGWYGDKFTTPAALSKSGTASKTIYITFIFNDNMTSNQVVPMEVSSPYSFATWNTKSNGTGTGYAASTSYSFKLKDVTLYATWGASNWIGQSVGLPSVGSRTGYKFEGWYHGNTYQGKSGQSASTFTSDATISAQWTTESYGYTVYYKGPKSEDLFSSTTGMAKYGTKVEVKAKTKNGYVATTSSYFLLITDIEEQNQYTFTYKYQDNKLTYTLGTYGTFEGVEPQPLTSYNISYGTVSPTDGKTYITLAVPNIKTGYEDYSFIGWTGGGPNTPTISTPTAEVKIDVNQVTYNGKTANYVANYDRISKRWKSGNIWRPIMNTYVKNADGTWHLVPKGKSWVKTKSGWVTEKTDD